MRSFAVPTRTGASYGNQGYFDYFEEYLGHMPNLYAAFTYSQHALGSFLLFQNRRSSLNNREKEVIALVVSELNSSTYCLCVHAMVARLNGFADENIQELRSGSAGFDAPLHALAQLVHSMVTGRGRPQELILDRFFEAGFSNEHLVDVILSIGEVTISNFLYRTMNVPIDYPIPPDLLPAEASSIPHDPNV